MSKIEVQWDVGKWNHVRNRLPKGTWSNTHPHLSEEVLIVNSAGINIGHYNRRHETWYVGEPAKLCWIDKITHWMELPENPNA